MTLAEMIRKVRLYLGDMNKAKYNDYEITSAINIALNITNMALTEIRSHLIQKTITLNADRPTLPRDFNRMVMIFGDTNSAEVPYYDGNDITRNALSYNIVGNTIIPTGYKASLKGCTMVYEYNVSDLENNEDEISLPSLLLEPIVYVASEFVEKRNIPQNREFLRNEIQRIAIGRDVDYYEPVVPFKV